MKKQIRKNVFETNSSSSHSLTLNTEDFSMDTSMTPKDGIVTIHRPLGEFGWEWFKNNDARTKALYAIIDGCEDLVRQAINRQLGAYLEITTKGDDSDGYYDDGYIDHDSQGNIRDNINTIDEMVSFIFNKNSWLFGGNDNGEAPPKFYVTPFYDSEGNLSDNNYILTMDLFGEKIEESVCKNVNSNLIENIIYHAVPNSFNNDNFIDEETGREYTYYNSRIDCNKKQITFRTDYDKDIDKHLVNASWPERHEYMEQFNKVITYEISKR